MRALLDRIIGNGASWFRKKKKKISNVFVLFFPSMFTTPGKANNQFSALFDSTHPVVNNFQFTQQATSPPLSWERISVLRLAANLSS